MKSKQELVNELNKELDKATQGERAQFFIDWYGEEWFYDDMSVWSEQTLHDAIQEVKQDQPDKSHSIPYMEICKSDVEDEITGEVTEQDVKKIADYMSDGLQEFWTTCKENAIEKLQKEKDNTQEE